MRLAKVTPIIAQGLTRGMTRSGSEYGKLPRLAKELSGIKMKKGFRKVTAVAQTSPQHTKPGTGNCNPGPPHAAHDPSHDKGRKIDSPRGKGIIGQ